MSPEINSLEWCDIMKHYTELGKDYPLFDFVSKNPRVVRLEKDGKQFTLIDRVESANRRRPIDELLKLGEE